MKIRNKRETKERIEKRKLSDTKEGETLHWHMHVKWGKRCRLQGKRGAGWPRRHDDDATQLLAENGSAVGGAARN